MHMRLSVRRIERVQRNTTPFQQSVTLLGLRSLLQRQVVCYPTSVAFSRNKRMTRQLQMQMQMQTQMHPVLPMPNARTLSVSKLLIVEN
ncbi:hypothetical protein I7I50_01274 [Histoplasma capsulatum G186AR]|uniref:Uncharacterized protein n=1 Tax=Ajellomyces capsulatus TaxID=5037 RepID=A0A8H7YUM9_AJECA|nr:hypothetical protein I7I52_08899 [Histoplasma capsulatum]QSS73198.1 hypothetical protein I7I50_01274 [Histoplasma capsulatum G186AR]